VIDPGIDVIVPIIVKNVGEKDAKNVEVELLGLTDDWSISPGRKIPLPDLIAADPSRGLEEGQQEYKEWIIRGPSKDVELSYDMEAKLTYDYQTVSTSLVRVVSSDYFREKNKGGGLKTSEYTGGPLLVNIKVPTSVISGGDGTVPIQFEIQNTGGGRVYWPGSDGKGGNLDKIKVSVEGISDCADDVRLIDGKSGFISCRKSVSGVDDFKDFSVTLTLDYGYYSTAPSSITILPEIN